MTLEQRSADCDALRSQILRGIALAHDMARCVDVLRCTMTANLDTANLTLADGETLTLAPGNTEGDNPHTTRDRFAYAALNRALDDARTGRSQNLASGIVGGGLAESRGSAVGIAWDGKGELTREAFLALLSQCECPAEWAPGVPDAKPQLTEAIIDVIGRRFDRRSVPKATDGRGRVLKTPENAWSARHALVRGRTDSDVAPGEAWGNVFLVVTLWEPMIDEIQADGTTKRVPGSPRLTFTTGREGTAGEGTTEEPAIREARAQLAGQILTAFETRIATVAYTATRITGWFQSLLTWTLNGTRLGKQYYIPGETAEIAKSLSRALQRQWGENWTWLPLATCAELAEGMEISLAKSVETLTRAFGLARDAARASKRKDGSSPADIGDDGCDTWQARVATLESAVRKVAHTLTEEGMKRVTDSLADLTITIDEIRIANEARREAAKASGAPTGDDEDDDEIASQSASQAIVERAAPVMSAAQARVNGNELSIETNRPTGTPCRVRKYNEDGARVTGWRGRAIAIGDAIRMPMGMGDYTLASVREIVWSDTRIGDYILRLA